MLNLYHGSKDYFRTEGTGEPLHTVPHEHVYDLDENKDKHTHLDAIKAKGFKGVKFGKGKLVHMFDKSVSLARRDKNEPSPLDIFRPFAQKHAENPTDHTPLLAGSDTLEEQGHHGLAALVRRAVELHQKYPGHIHTNGPKDAGSSMSFSLHHYPRSPALPVHGLHVGAVSLYAPLFTHEAEDIRRDPHLKNSLGESVARAHRTAKRFPGSTLDSIYSSVSSGGVPIHDPVMPLARGAAVVNNQYYPNGQFLARALESIESAVARRRKGRARGTNAELPQQLAREEHTFAVGAKKYTIHAFNRFRSDKGHKEIVFHPGSLEDHNSLSIKHRVPLHTGVTLMKHLMEFMHEHLADPETKSLHFIAGTSDADGKRAAVYRHVAQSLAEHHGYDLKESQEDEDYTGFLMTRRKRKPEIPQQLARKILTSPFGTYDMWTSPPDERNGKRYHDINFSKRDTEYPGSHLQELTNESGPAGAYLFHHVGKFVDDFVHNEKPERFQFSSDLHEPKRVKAYDTVAKLLAAKHGYDLMPHHDTQGARYYRFHRKPDAPSSLARFDKGLTGQPATLTPEHIKDIEDAHGITGDHRLPYTVSQEGTIRTNVKDLHKWFDHVASKQGNIPHTEEGKIAYLNLHFGDAAKQFPNENWYGKTIKHLEKGLKKAFPMYGHKAMKALVAITSPNQKPHVNLDTVFRMMHAGHKVNPKDPLLGIPLLNDHALEKWKEEAGANVADMTPGLDVHERAKWAQKFKHIKEPGYSVEPWVLNEHGEPVMKIKPRESEDAERYKMPPGHKVLHLPSVDKQGRLRAKGWGTASQSIQAALKKIQEVHGAKGEKGLEKWLDENTKQGKEVFGPKVSNFYRNLIGDKDLVTKDVWFSRTFNRLLGTMGVKGAGAPRNKKEAALMDASVRGAAKALGMTPADFQANLWYYEQNLHRIFGARADSQDYAGGVDKALLKHGPLPKAE